MLVPKLEININDIGVSPNANVPATQRQTRHRYRVPRALPPSEAVVGQRAKRWQRGDRQARRYPIFLARTPDPLQCRSRRSRSTDELRAPPQHSPDSHLYRQQQPTVAADYAKIEFVVSAHIAAIAGDAEWFDQTSSDAKSTLGPPWCRRLTTSER